MDDNSKDLMGEIEQTIERVPHWFHYAASKADIELFQVQLKEWALEEKIQLEWDDSGALAPHLRHYLDCQDKGLNTPLHWACHHRKIQMATHLVDLGANPTFSNHADITPVEQMWSRGGLEGSKVAKRWIESGKVDTHWHSDKRGSLLHVLAINDVISLQAFDELSESLFIHGVDLNAVNGENQKMDDVDFIRETHSFIKDDIQSILTRLRLQTLPTSNHSTKSPRL